MLTHTRTNTRKATERRVSDRRRFDYKFASPEWIKLVKRTYVAWPKFDRRLSIRRISERRQLTTENVDAYSKKFDYSSDLLTNDERLFFDNLFKKDKH